jgi:hypothetical protein
VHHSQGNKLELIFAFFLPFHKVQRDEAEQRRSDPEFIEYKKNSVSPGSAGDVTMSGHNAIVREPI